MQDKNKIEGSNNMFVGGNINLTLDDISYIVDKKVSLFLKSIIENINCSINKCIPNGIILSRIQNEQVVCPFDCERILESLGFIGVTLIASIEALSETAQLIRKYLSLHKEISTRIVRNFITESLYGLDEDKYGKTTIENWGDRYIRRYGSETELRIIETNGTERILKHEYIKNKIIPAVVREITEGTGPQRKTFESITQSHLSRMSTEIFDSLSSLNLYRLNYETAFQVVKELFTQPPHPWLAPAVRSYEHVNYDFSRLISNFKKTKKYKSFGKVSKCKYALKELTHHACSCLLCYYSIYMGCGTLAPLFILHEAIKAVINNNNEKLARMFKLAEIRNDLSKHKLSVDDLCMNLDAIINLFQSSKEVDAFYIELLYQEVEKLNNIVSILVTPFLKIKKLEEINKYKNKFTQRCIKYLLNDIFHLFPGIDYERNINNVSYWIFHNYTFSIFKQIKSAMLVVSLYNDIDNINKYIEDWIGDALGYTHICNTIIFLYDEKYVSLFPQKRTHDKDIIIINLSYQQLIMFVHDDEPVVDIVKEISNQIL